MQSKFAPIKKTYDTIWLESTDSTNNEVIRNTDKLDNLSVIAAKNQTAGRGQRGNKWSSKEGENLTFSILLTFSESGLPPISATEQFAISQVATLSLIDLLKTFNIRAKIKWSNDIYVGDRKISGMLIENSLRENKLSSSVIGIGLNVNQDTFPENLPNPVSMTQLSGEKYDCKEILEKYMEIFLKYLPLIFSPQGQEELHSLFTELMYRKDEKAQYTNLRTGGDFDGIIRGISGIGLLIVENEKGESLEFGFKEIAFII